MVDFASSYKLYAIDITLHNIFLQDVILNIQIFYEKNQKPQKQKKDAGGRGAAQKDKAKEEAAAAKNKATAAPEPYACKLEQVKVRKN